MKKSIMQKYARLAVRKGINVQKGQGVQINVAPEQYEFARMCVREAYRAGAAWVTVEWRDQTTEKYAFKYQTVKRLSTVEKWKQEKLAYLGKELPCHLHILSEDPDGMKGVNPEKVTKVQRAQWPFIQPYRKEIEGRHQWCIVGVPGPEWAKKVFPDMKKQAAVNALWEAILTTARVDDDPEAAWDKHNAELQSHADRLNELQLESLHIQSELGTDLTIGLMENGIWMGGGEYTDKGVYFNPNMPTEEVFTTPRSGCVEGVAVASKPLSCRGKLIENFSVTFKDGRAVAHSAEVGDEALEQIISADEGSARLGEVALVPVSSPINRSGVLFYNTLYDENAACHLALGFGFDNAVKGSESMDYDQITAAGVNRSMMHVDFMIGTPGTKITGKGKNGETVIFENGEWAI